MEGKVVLELFRIILIQWKKLSLLFIIGKLCNSYNSIQSLCGEYRNLEDLKLLGVSVSWKLFVELKECVVFFEKLRIIFLKNRSKYFMVSLLGDGFYVLNRGKF